MTCSPQRHRREEQSLNPPWSRSEGVSCHHRYCVYICGVSKPLRSSFTEGAFASVFVPPLLLTHLWHRNFQQQQSALSQVQSAFAQQEKSTPRTARASAFSAGAISLQHSRRFNCPSSEHEQLPLDQQAQPAVLDKQAQPSHSRCNEPLPSRRIQSSFAADSYSQLGCHSAIIGGSTTIGQNRGWRPLTTTPPPFHRYDMAQGFLEGVLIPTRQSIIILIVGTLGQRGGRDWVVLIHPLAETQRRIDNK